MITEKLIACCQLGDKDAFRMLFEEVEKKALSYAYLISGNRGIAEDILQETYIKCMIQIKKLREPKAFKVWFYRILVRTGWEMTRKHSCLVPIELEATDDSLYYGSVAPEDAIDLHEVRKTVKSAVDNLSEKLRTVVILHYYNDMSIEEIAKVLGCLKSTVKSRLFYARKNLKNKLYGYFEDENKNISFLERKCSEDVS